jgi:hypothetical protein
MLRVCRPGLKRINARGLTKVHPPDGAYSSIHRDHDVGRPYHYVTLPACLDQARSRWKISAHPVHATGRADDEPPDRGVSSLPR